MPILSAEHLKNQILQYIIDRIPQPVIWYNADLQDIFSNFSAEDIFRIAQQKTYYIENYAQVFQVEHSGEDQPQNTTQVFEYKNISYFKREILVENLQKQSVIHAICLQRAIDDHLEPQNQQSREFFDRFFSNSLKPIIQTIAIWSHKDLDEHYRAAKFASQLTEYLGLSEMTQNTVFYSTLLMDVGNHYVPNEILDHQRDLSDIEFSMVQSHAEAGFKIFKNIPFETSIAEIILQHHERYDGSGYPMGLKEDEISLEARIVAIADTLIAMTSPRPHRPALSVQTALANIKKQGGIKFDPRLTQICVEMIENRLLKENLFTSQFHRS